MCVIINFKPGQSIPMDMLEAACEVNPHGFGVAVSDREKLTVYKNYNPQGNEAKNIARILEESKELPTVLHLRYQTKGEKTIENCHPFYILNSNDHGMDLVLMHNGTIYDKNLEDNKKSDSALLCETILRPLFERTLGFIDQPELFNDPLVNAILDKYAGSSNKFSLIDNLGNQLIVNKDAGKEFEWGWASNDYSFDVTHRLPKNNYYYGRTASQGIANPTNHTKTGGSTTTGANVVPWEGKNAFHQHLEEEDATLTEQLENIREALELDKEQDMGVTKIVKISDPAKRKNFCQEAGLSSLEELLVWESDDFVELATMYPEATALLLMDLQYELFCKVNNNVNSNAA